MQIHELEALGSGPAEPARPISTLAEQRDTALGQFAFWYGVAPVPTYPDVMLAAYHQEALDADSAIQALWLATEQGR